MSNKNYNPMLLTDFYKIGHPFQYPKGTTLVYSNMTPRKSRIKTINKIVFFGLQYFIKEYLMDYFQTMFFDRNKQEVIDEYKRIIQNTLGGIQSYQHIEKLHDLGYLPIEIKALPEGSLVDMRIPFLTIKNTLPEFYWLTNFFETLLSTTLWQGITSATISHEYKKILTHYAKETGFPQELVQFQAHDFSFRGMSSLESGVISGMGHLLSFVGTDTITAILGAEKYYNANVDKELVGCSVPATEHATMTGNIIDLVEQLDNRKHNKKAETLFEEYVSKDKDSNKEVSNMQIAEYATFKRLITKVYPSGIVSIVSDSFNIWDVLTSYLPKLKNEVVARNGKVVVRPDSGDPVKIICGWSENYDECEYNEDDKQWHKGYHNDDGDFFDEGILSIEEKKGVVELLWDAFQGTMTDKGYKLLDSHVGVIYGDSITTERANMICERLKRKGFASQCVFGVGSYTFQYNTRDTFGIAQKATYIEVNNEGETLCRNIYKKPITDDGTKNSACGLLQVKKVMGKYVNEPEGHYILNEQVSWEEEKDSELKTVYKDGKLIKDYTFEEVRKNLNC